MFKTIILIALCMFICLATGVLAATWELGIINDSGDTGLYCDAQIDSAGDIHIVYLQSDQGALKVISMFSGVWQTAEIVDNSGAVAGHCGIAVEQSGTPKVSYRRSDTGALWYAGPETPPQWSTEIIDESGDTGLYCDARIDSLGDIHVVYLRNDQGELNVISRLGGVWQTVEIVDNSGAVAGHCGIAVEQSGTPKVSYRRSDTEALWYAGPEIPPRWAIETISEAGDVGRYVSLVNAPDNRIGSIFYRYNPHSLGSICMVVVESDSIGATLSIVDSIGSSATSDAHVDLAVSPDGHWHVSYRNTIETALYYASTDTVMGANVIVQCPGDTTIPPLSQDSTFTILGFQITNVSTMDLSFNYYVTAVGTLIVEDNGDHASLSGTTDILAPGDSYSPPGLVLRLVMLRDLAYETLTYNVSAVEYPEIADSCATIITIEPPQEVEVLISNFEAVMSESGVKLTWTISSDERIKGFNIYRTSGTESTNIPINSDGLIRPMTKEYIDNNVLAGHIYQYTLGVIKEDGSELRSMIAEIRTPSLPLTLRQNYPNPFNPITNIRFSLPVDSRVVLEIFDATGKHIATLVDKEMVGGLHSIDWDGRNSHGEQVSSGIYFYRLSAGKETISRKMVLLR